MMRRKAIFLFTLFVLISSGARAQQQVYFGDSMYVTTMAPLVVTPRGEDPALYILKQVAAKAKENAKTLEFEATVRDVMGCRDMNILLNSIPKGIKFFMKIAMKMSGMWPLIDYFTGNKEVSVITECDLFFSKKKIEIERQQVMDASPDMNEKQVNALFKVTTFNPFTALYGDDRRWHPKEAKGFGFKVVGALEEDGEVIDVLSGQKDRTKVTIFVVEDSWGIKRVEYTHPMGTGILEAKNVGHDVYLPVSYKLRPNYTGLPADSLQKLIRKELESGEKIKRRGRNIMKRVDKQLDKNPDASPGVTFSYRVNYRNVKKESKE